ncbi:MAG: DUF4855 domain-containing protein [Gloeomargarita sp. SKYG116]|nr:DUF4855 domain-containing protein [Gloeomargarita sp. SKYG116]MCS7292767.1 DUF4855 domain-containing protein [Gloeomargarita sp. SKYB120]MDW8178330.1 DUF4855 domain-containing protein [Gloeomargarita sp. SKYBB_i_bin120]MDW8402291.1 DUF4855 domain-containing protein [Gloeomargarita sp. SKYGB_i_bin116]
MPYFPPRQTTYNYLQHLVLMYGHASQPWTIADLQFYVAHQSPSGVWHDWLFDSFLFLNITSRNGRDYRADINVGTTMSGEGDFFAVCSPQPAGVQEWEELLDFYAATLRTLDQTIAELLPHIPTPLPHKRNAVLMIPYPHITQTDFGYQGWNFSTQGQNLDRATRQRLAACQWFISELQKRLPRLNYVHILGMYWMFETVFRCWDVDDHWLLKELRRFIHQMGWAFFWIPFYSTYNIHLLDDYQNYYFDVAFLQPNYMFYQRGVNLAQAAQAAQQRGAGIEMEYYLELDEPIAVQGERQRRFREYLNGGVLYGYMTESACAYFLGQRSLERMAVHDDPQEREFYQDIYDFLRGTYTPKPLP